MPWCPSCGAEYRAGFTRCSECDVELSAAPPGPPRIGPEWVPVAVFTTGDEARLAQGLLSSGGVEAAVLDASMHIAPYGMTILGEVQLVVPPGEEGRARELLRAAAAGEAPVEPDGTAGEDGP